MTWPRERVRAITVDGKRRVLTVGPREPRPPRPRRRKPEPSETPRSSKAEAPTATAPRGKATTRTKTEVEALIREAGTTPPEWWDSVQLSYPRTLQLNWPKPKPKEPWTPNKYPAQYVISVINPNPSKWKQGAKLFHHMLSVNKGNARALASTMDRLGHIYGNLLGDYARGAFWWRSAGKAAALRPHQKVSLAACYWKLSSKTMAASSLRSARSASSAAIQLWAEMGELNKALQLARSAASGRNAAMTLLAAGNACRSHGQSKEAIHYFERVLALRGAGRQKKWIDKCKGRARACIDAIKVFEALDLSRVPDGKYRGSALGYRGNVDVDVEVKEGRIASIKIVKHKEDWFYTSFTDIPQQIIESQSLKGVDSVTGATFTSTAIVNATGKALASAMR